MLDEAGITLQEVNKKYPSRSQVLKYDTCMDYDAANKPKVISSFEMCVNMILTLLFMKPGQYPSIPELGINIESYLFEYADDPSIPREIKTKLPVLNQIRLLLVYHMINSINFIHEKYMFKDVI